MFPDRFSIVYLMIMILVSMLLHMMLGSNTTTLSVFVPSLLSGFVGQPIKKWDDKIIAGVLLDTGDNCI